MTPEQVAEILLVQAAEEVQPAALPPEARIDALEAAGDLDDERAWFARRAAYLLGHALAGARPLLRVRDALAPGVGWNLALPGLLGFASNALGPHEQIHVLYNPIVGLIAWSLAVYLGLIEHRRTQAKGRARIFENYRLRVASVMRDYGLNERDQAPKDSRAVHEAKL